MKRYHFLENLIKENNLSVGVEIGVWYGETFFYLLNKCSVLTLYGIEIWCDGPYDEPGKPMSNHHLDQKQNRRDVLEKSKTYNGRAIIIENPSTEAARDFQDNSLDFVFIDANHSYETVKADIKAWTPKVKEGGFITGHDYSTSWPGVKRAVDEQFNNVNISEDSMWWIRK